MMSDQGRFTLRRGEHSFGPYTLSEVSAYVATGNLIHADTLFDHELQTWTTVAAVLREHGVTPPTAVIPPPSAAQNAMMDSTGIGVGAAPGTLDGGAPGPAYGGVPGTGMLPGFVVPGSRQGMAIAALVLGIASIMCCGFFAGIPAIVLGAMAMKDPVNRGMGIAGLVLGILSFVIIGIWAVIQMSGILP